MSAKYKSPSFLLPNELNTSANPANDTGINSLYSMDFNGSSDYIDVGYSLNGISSITYSVWIKPEQPSGVYGYIITAGDYSATDRMLSIAINTSNRKIFVFGGQSGGGIKESNFTVTYGTWYHVAIVYTNNQDVDLYVNGNAEGSIQFNDTSSIASGSPTRIGVYSGILSNYFKGQIDEVAIFNRALNSTEISALYDGTGSNIRPSNLIATNLNPIVYYPLGEQAQMQGYLGNEASSEWQFPNGVLQDYVMDFDGSDNINSEANISSASSFTASVWINRDDSNTQYIYGQWVDGTSASQSWVIQTVGGIVYFNIRDASLATKSAISTTSLTTGVWYNIIAVWTGSNIKLYINNSLEDTTACTSMNNPSTAVKLAIGSSSNNVSPFNGKISNAVIWNSDQESNRDNIYNNGSPQTTYTVTPQNWWKLNADSVYTPSAPNYTTALDFDGADEIQIPSFSLSSEFSIGVWLNADTFAAGSSLIFGYNANNFEKIEFNGSSSILIKNATTNITYSGTSWNLNEWQHLLITRDSSNNLKIYRNREYWGGGSHSGTFIFDRISGFNNSTKHFNGRLSNIAIFNSALTSSQVSTLFNFGTPETNISFNPQAWWKLDNTTTGIQDSSGNGNNGTNNGTTQVNSSVAVVPSWKIPSALPITTTPNYTTALDFNNDYIEIADNNNLDFGTADFSLSAWFKTSVTPLQHQTILSKQNPENNSEWVLQVEYNTNKVAFRANATTILRSTTLVNNGNWNNVIITRISGVFYLYLNSSQENTATLTQDLTNTQVLRIGRRFVNYNGYFDGEISNVAIFNSGLTSSQVSTLYNGGTPETAISFSPVSWWKLDTGGSTITDYGSGGNDGTNNGAIQVTSDVLTLQPVNGVSTTLPSTALQQSDLQFDSPYSNYSLSFDGTNYIDCGDSDIFSFGNGTTDSPFSVSAWIKVGDTGINRIVNKVGGTNAEWLFSTGTNNRTLVLNLYSSGATSSGPNRGVAGSTSLNSYVNQWVHVAGTYDGRGNNTAYDGMKLYFNGQLETTTILTAGATYTAMANGVAPLRIGSDIYFTNYYFNGNIDETSIFNYELTSAQVLEIYNNGKPKDLTTFSGTAPISWWRLGENAYFQDSTLVLPNSITGAPNGEASTNNLEMISADAPGTYANGIGTNLDILDRVGDAALSTSNSQSYNMIPSDISPYVPAYVGDQISNTYSMSFNGTDEYFDAGNPTELQLTGAFSVSFWMKTNTTGSRVFVSKDSNTSNPRGFNVGYSNTYAGGYFNLFDGTTVYGAYVNSSHPNYVNIRNNNWHHIVAVYTPSTSVALFIDGNLIESNTTNIPASVNFINNNLNIGRKPQSGGVNYYQGELDEVAIFDTALNAGQIYNDIYQPTATGTNQTADLVNNPNLPNPVAWYRMGD